MSGSYLFEVRVGVLLCLFLMTATSFAAQVADSTTDSPQRLAENKGLPLIVRYNGEIHGVEGSRRDPEVLISFSLYSEPQGGDPLWMETQSVSIQNNGKYAVLLGSSSPDGIPLSLFATGEARWLGVRVVEEGAEELPRVRLVSVPYALAAGNAQFLSGRPLSDFVLRNDFGENSGATLPSPNLETTGALGSIGQIAKFTGTGDLGDSVITEIAGRIGIGTANPVDKLQVAGNILLIGQATHQISLAGALSSGRLGQDSVGFFFSSDTPSKPIRFLTSSGGLAERVRIDADGNMGIGTTVPASKLHVAGNLLLSGSPSHQITLGGATRGRIGQDIKGLFASADTPGSSIRFLSWDNNAQRLYELFTMSAAGNLTLSPSAYSSQIWQSQVSFGPGDTDVVQSYIGQEGHQAQFRLSRGSQELIGNPEARHFFITPYHYGMGIEYPSTIEIWSRNLSVHSHHQGCTPDLYYLDTSSCNASAHFWVGDTNDGGGLFSTAYDVLTPGGAVDRSKSFSLIASDTFGHTSHGEMLFVVRDPADAFRFQVGPSGPGFADDPLSYKNFTKASIDGSGNGVFAGGLDANGLIHSRSGGIRFPDGTTQTSAATGGADITGVTAGSGLTGGGLSGNVTLSVDSSLIQSRVTGTCPSGQYVRVIAGDGSVTCGTDATSGSGGGATVFSGTTASALVLSTQSNSTLLTAPFTFATAQSSVPLESALTCSTPLF